MQVGRAVFQWAFAHVSVWCCLVNKYNRTHRLPRAWRNSELLFFFFFPHPCRSSSGFWEPSCLHGQDAPVSLSWSRQERCAYRFCPTNQRHPSQRRSWVPLPTGWHREWLLGVNKALFALQTGLFLNSSKKWLEANAYTLPHKRHTRKFFGRKKKTLIVRCTLHQTPLGFCLFVFLIKLQQWKRPFGALSLLVDAHNPRSAHQALFLWHRSGPWDRAG